MYAILVICLRVVRLGERTFIEPISFIAVQIFRLSTMPRVCAFVQEGQ